MRAPAESTSHTTGSSCLSAYSVRRTIFSTVRAPHEPALTVGSLAMTHTGRPSTRPRPVTTPSAGRSGAAALASSASSTNEPSSSSRANRSRTNSLPWRSSLAASLARLPESARSAAARNWSLMRNSCSADGEDGDVVGERLGGEVPGRLEQDLAQRGGLLARVAPQDAGDALLTEQLLAGAGFGQPVGVEQQEVAGRER